MMDDDDNNNKIEISWDQVQGLITKSLAQIIEFGPDIIFGLSRGGLPVACTVSNIIDVPMYTIGVKSYNNNGEQGKIEITQWPNEINDDISNKRILIIDDLNDTGITLAHISSEVSNFNPESMCIFALHNKVKEKQAYFKENVQVVYGSECKDIWLVYPWENKNLFI